MPRQLSAEAIRMRIGALEEQARRMERDAAKGLKAAAAVIAKYNLSIGDLRRAIEMSKGRGKRNPLAIKRIAVKYRDGEGNTWTGRGRPPLWLVAAEKAGRKRETFLVEAKKAPTKTAKPRKLKKASKSAQPKNGSAPTPAASAISA